MKIWILFFLLIGEDLYFCLKWNKTAYPLFLGLYIGELEISGKFTFSQGFLTFLVNISTLAKVRVKILTKKVSGLLDGR